MKYTVTARRWSRGWELHITDDAGDPVGVTQTRTLRKAEAMVRDYLALDNRPAGEIDIRPELDTALTDAVAAARKAVREAAEAQEAAGAQSREAARRLKEAGLSGNDIAAVLKVSPQRVSQLVKP